MSTVTFNKRHVATDVTAYSLSPIAYADGTVGSAASLLGVFKSVEFTLTRDAKETTAAQDTTRSFRTIRINGTFSAHGMVPIAGSPWASIFAAGSNAQLDITEAASGDIYELQVYVKEFKTATSENPTEDSISGEILHAKYAPAGGTLADIPLD